MLKGFDKYEKKDCVRTNVIVAIFFAVTLIAAIVIDFILIKIRIGGVNENHNGFADLAMIALFIFFTMAVLIIYSIIATLKIKLYKGLLENLKSLMTLGLCNILVAVFLYVAIRDLIGWMYLGTVVVLCSASFSIRYSLVRFKEKNY